MSEEMKKKVLFYYNPYSGNGVYKNKLDYICERVQESGRQIIPIRAAKGKVIDETFRDMKQEEYDRIIVAGGDGTVNLCVNAMIKHDIHLPIAVMPAGTANDFAYYFGLPSDIESIMDIALGDNTIPADVGHVNDKYFINVAAMGALIDVSQKTDPNLKNRLGAMAYYLTALTEIPQIRPLPVKLITPEETYEENIFFMVVMNGESAGGFRKLNPEASINDGKLDVIAFRQMPVLDFMPMLFEVIGGKSAESKNVLYFQTDELTIESEAYISTDIDGEHGEKFPLHFTVEHQRLNVFVKGK